MGDGWLMRDEQLTTHLVYISQPLLALFRYISLYLFVTLSVLPRFRYIRPPRKELTKLI